MNSTPSPSPIRSCAHIVAALSCLSFALTAQATPQPGSNATQIPATQQRPDIPGFTEYEPRTVAGFTVLLHRSLADERSIDGPRVMAALTWDLDLLIERIPAHALDLLRSTTPIWVTPSLPSRAGWAARGLCHHPSPDWLEANGYGRERAGAIEICNVADYLLWRAEQPLCVLHEMAHAYQFQLSDPPAIRQAFDAAKASGRYEAVPFVMLDRSVTRRAYALNNHMEYFAELSEAYYGRNDYFPFTRADLKTHDPEGYAMIESIWTTPTLIPGVPRLLPTLPSPQSTAP